MVIQVKQWFATMHISVALQKEAATRRRGEKNFFLLLLIRQLKIWITRDGREGGFTYVSICALASFQISALISADSIRHRHESIRLLSEIQSDCPSVAPQKNLQTKLRFYTNHIHKTEWWRANISFLRLYRHIILLFFVRTSFKALIAGIYFWWFRRVRDIIWRLLCIVLRILMNCKILGEKIWGKAFRNCQNGTAKMKSRERILMAKLDVQRSYRRCTHARRSIFISHSCTYIQLV